MACKVCIGITSFVLRHPPCLLLPAWNRDSKFPTHMIGSEKVDAFNQNSGTRFELNNKTRCLNIQEVKEEAIRITSAKFACGKLCNSHTRAQCFAFITNETGLENRKVLLDEDNLQLYESAKHFRRVGGCPRQCSSALAGPPSRHFKKQSSEKMRPCTAQPEERGCALEERTSILQAVHVLDLHGSLAVFHEHPEVSHLRTTCPSVSFEDSFFLAKNSRRTKRTTGTHCQPLPLSFASSPSSLPHVLRTFKTA